MRKWDWIPPSMVKPDITWDKNDFNKASDFYISIIQNTEIRKDTTDFIKEVIYADSKIHDREVKLLEKCKKEWNIK